MSARWMTPYLIGIGIALAGFLVPRLRRNRSPIAQAFVRPVGHRPSGPGGAWTRGDHFRAAGRYALATVALFGLGLSFMVFADRWPNLTPMNTAFTYPGLISSFFGFVVLWLCLRSFARGLFPRRSSAAEDQRSL